MRFKIWILAIVLLGVSFVWRGARPVPSRTMPTSVIESGPVAPSVLSTSSIAASAAVPSLGASEEVLPKTLAQISALQKIKAGWTAAERKVDVHLLHAQAAREGREVAPGVRPRQSLEMDAQGRVAVDVTGVIDEALIKGVAAAGGEVLRSHPHHGMLTAMMPPDRVVSLAELGGVREIVPADQPTYHRAVVSPEEALRGRFIVNSDTAHSDPVLTAQGLTVSEGDVATGADQARALFGATGAGVKIGVLSDSIRYLQEAQAAGELGPVTVLPGEDGLDLPASPKDEGEGTAMLEIIHDLAPDAELYFATASGGVAGFVDNILLLRAYGCDVIVDDVGYGNEGAFQDDLIARAVNSVVADGAVYVSSAGNDGNFDQGSSGTWEGDFNPAGFQPSAPVSGTIHQFGGGRIYNTLTNNASAPRFLRLEWADPLGKAANDYDLYLVDQDGNVVDYSVRTQDGTQAPSESLSKVSSGDRVLVMLTIGDPRYLRLTCRGQFAISTGGAIHGHAAAEGALGVAAVRARSSFPAAFDGGAKNGVESFSSDGPRRVFFTPEGAALTPGDFSSSGGVVRQKPDLASADGVSTTVAAEEDGRRIFNPFFGTSAAAPHVAAVAALMRSLNPSLTGLEVRSALLEGCLHPLSAGFNRNSGFGVLRADYAMQKVFNPTRPAILSMSPTGGVAGVVVTLAGSNLQGVRSVTVAGQDATVIDSTATSLRFSAPAKVSSGFVVVRTDHGSARSPVPFFATLQPGVTNLSPAVAAVGQLVTVEGSHFEGISQVLLNGVPVGSLFTPTSKSVGFIVPSGAVSGPVTVVTANGSGRSVRPLVIGGPPTVSAFSPSRGGEGDFIGIGGSGLSIVTGVQFGGVLSTNVSLGDDGVFWCSVPKGAVSGTLTVITPLGTAVSATAFTVVARPANDAFASAQVISGGSGSLTADNTAATKEADEPVHGGSYGGKSLWYSWTAPASGYVVFEASSLGVDTVMGVYTGTALNALTTFSGADDYFGTQASRAAFFAEAGTTYRIAVDGYYYGNEPSTFAESGSFKLSWSTGWSGPNLAGFFPEEGPAGTMVTLTGSNLGGASVVRFNGIRVAVSLHSDSQLRLVVPSGVGDGPFVVTTPFGSISSHGIFRVKAGVANDRFADAPTLTGAAGSVSGSNAGASREAGEPVPFANAAGRSVWYRWVAPSSGEWSFNTFASRADTTLAVYTGGSLASLALVAANDDADQATASRVRFSADVGTTYWIMVDGGAGDEGRFTLSWEPGSLPPFISAFSPSAASPGDTLLIDGSRFSKARAVQFNGARFSDFNVLSDHLIRVTVPAQALSGPIRVVSDSGPGVSVSAFLLKGSRPANDQQAQGRVITGNAVALEDSNLGATVESFETSNGAKPEEASVWYRWTTPAAGDWAVSVEGLDFEPVLSVYTGASLVASVTEEGAPANTSRLMLHTGAGEAYNIRVGGRRAGAGRFRLHLKPALAASTIYQTGFEDAEGFDSQFRLINQQGWTATGFGGNGLTTDFFIGQGNQAFVGFDKSLGAGQSLNAWVAFDYTPVLANNPVLAFETQMQVARSRSGGSDVFGWSVQDTQGSEAFAILFDNATRQVGYTLGAGGAFIPSRLSFDTFTPYRLQIAMDLAANKWAAWLGNNLITSGQPIGPSGAPAIGFVMATWRASPTQASGNNFMIFDDYKIYQILGQSPKIVAQPQSQSVNAGGEVMLSAVANGLEPLNYQWLLGGQPIPGATNSLLHLYNITPASSGRYSLTVANVFGNATSQQATLSVTAATAPTLAATRGVSPGKFVLTLGGTAGSAYTIETSANLPVWQVWSNVVLSGPQATFEITPSTPGPHLFKARLAP